MHVSAFLGLKIYTSREVSIAHDFLSCQNIFRRLLLYRFAFAHASGEVIALRHICGAALLLWSLLSSGLAQDIPSGFGVDRYARLWERNPFTLVKPTQSERLPSPFEKLFLASWLKDGETEVVLVQNSETNEVQRITATPNHNNLRLLEMHPNPNPLLVAVVISDGKDQGTVKFRLDLQPSASQTPPMASGEGTMSRLHPGLRKVHTEGGPGPNSTLKERQRQRSSPDSASTSSTLRRN